MIKGNIIFTGLAVFIIAIFLFWKSCSRNKLEEKGFIVSNTLSSESSEEIEGIDKDSLIFETRPSSVLLTGISNVRLTTVYKVNLNKRDESTFIGSNNFMYNYT